MLTSDDKQVIENLAKLIIGTTCQTGTTGKEKADYFVEYITRHEHRTNQQTFFRNVIIEILKDYSNRENGQFDGRNQNVVEFCKAIKKQVNDAYFPYI